MSRAIETVAHTDRTPIPWTTKIDPLWWLMNDEDRIAPPQVNALPYWPDYPQWFRNVMWWFRNPATNFFDYIIGVRDRNYTITGTVPVAYATLYDVGQYGWKWHVIHWGWMRLPFVSYSGTHWLFYIGWRYTGGFSVKFNVHGIN